MGTPLQSTYLMPDKPPSPSGGPSAALNTHPRQHLTAVVMAAGLGTRMRSTLPKVLHPICGRPMLAYVLDAAVAATGTKPLVVISPPVAAVADAFAEDADFATQAEPLGTADAIAAALSVLPDEVGEIVVLSGDVPLVDASLLVELATARRENDAAIALVSVDMDDPAMLGRVVRGRDGRITRVVEHKDATPDELAIDEINAGLYAFDAEWLRRRIGDVKPSPVTGELYLPELIPLARADDRPVATLEVEDDGTLLGINDRVQLADAELEMRLRINEAHMRAGVTMQDPASTFIDATVRIAADVTLEPGVILRGATVIERDAVIRAGSTKSSIRTSANARSCGPASWKAPSSKRTSPSGPSHMSARTPTSVPTSSWATMPRSRTAASVPAPRAITSATWAMPTWASG